MSHDPRLIDWQTIMFCCMVNICMLQGTLRPAVQCNHPRAQRGAVATYAMTAIIG